ncbi:YadA-like family protein [Paraburkholderia solisilvae]|uniref:YadA-like family protein n=2 Tax=Paraburkholderia solisilvae TaxID=624376 RepID=UPI00362BA32B
MYSSGKTSGTEDSIAVGGYMDVWKTATFWGGVDMQQQKISHLANGDVTTSSKDAINGSQLYGVAGSVATALGGGSTVNTDGTVKTPTYNVAGSTYSDVGSALAAVDAKAGTGSADGVKYDSSTHTGVTLSGAGGTTLSNVKAGAADMDAVNLAQLKAAGLNVDTSGNVSNSFVAYDDATKGTITLAGGTAGTSITNLKAGAVSSSSTDAINGSQLYNVASSTAQALGGGSAVNADGAISKPEYKVGGNTVDGVDGAVSALDTRITDMSSAANAISDKLKYVKFGQTNALDATASGQDAVAIGGFAQAIGDNTLAIGAQSRAMGTNSVAIGYGSSTTQANTFAVGSSTAKRRIVNVADATGVSDAVTLGQMNTAIGAALVNSGVKNNGLLGASTMMLGASQSSKTPDQLIVSGPTTLSTPTDAIGKNGIAIGLNSHANADNAVAAGQNVSVLGANGVAVGQNIAVGADSAVAIGVATSVASENSVAIGSNGTEVNTNAANAVAIGSGVSVGGQNSVGLGSNIVVGTANSVVLGANSSDDNRANTVSVGSSAVPGMGTSMVRRQIINVAAGTQDTDAVNVSQLKGVTATLGGGAGVNADGTIKKPNYNVAGGTYTDVGAALAAVDTKAGAGSVDAVKYDTSAHDKVTFNGASGTTLSNVKAGAADTDAVNLAQLKAAGLNVDTSGTVTNSFVAYDDATKGKVTLAGGSAGTTITNVKAGALSATSTDAVNGAQLYATNQNVSSLNTQITNINGQLADAVKYDTSAHDKVTFNGTNGTKLSNVTAGTADMDAVNLAQLKAAGLNVDTSGNVTNSFVAYDDATKGKVTLAGGTNGTTISNVKAGTADLDAVNLAQLKAAGLNVDTSGNVTNSFVAYDDATKGKVTLAGGSAGTTITNVKAGALNATSTDAVNGAQLYATNQDVAKNTGDITTLNTQVTNINGELADAVKYDTSAHDKVTLAGGATGTTITNVKAGAVGAASTDAINGSQLYNTAGSTAAALGGGSSVDANGRIVKPSYDVAGGTYTDVGSALAAVDAKAASGSVDGVKYDTSAHDKVTFNGTNGTKLSNVTAGTADMDAVNLAQLKAAGLNVDTSGNVTNSFVAYDDATKGKVTLAGGSAGTTITNVKAGALNATSTDAVNGAQLYATNQDVAKNTGDITTLNTQVTNINGELADAVKYDTSAHDKVTLAGGANGTTISNVKAGAADMDAVNLAQLKAAGLNVDTSGTVTNSFVAYDDATKGKVTLAGGANGTTISNVKAGAADMDAVNLAQLKAAGLNVDTSGTVTNSFVAYDDATKGKVTLAGGAAGTTITNVKAGGVSSTSTDAINGSQLYNTASSTAAALGGGSSVDANGRIAKPSYDVAGGTYTDVGSALAAVDAKAASGSVDGVKYDTSAHDKVTFNGTNGTKLSNVTAGTADMDAVNLAQLKAAGLNVDTSGNVTNSFVAYDDATKGKVTLAGGTNGTTITNVKAGAIGAASTDAINGSQLYGEANSVASALGGGAAVNTDGTIKAPTYTVQGQTKSDVGSALAAIDTATTGNTTSITNLTNNINNGKIGLVQQDAATKTITVAKATDGTKVDFTGTAGARQLNGVSAGQADTDAVNMAQLKAAGLNVDTSGNVTNSFVAYDDATKGKVTLAGGSAGTTITNVKAGAVSATSTDAINGSQLYTLASSETKALGGGSTVNPDGSISMPEYSVGGKTVDGVDGAVTALDTRITDMSSSMNEIAPKLKYIKFGDTNALDATAAGADAVAIGGFAQAMGDGALAIGANARAMAQNSVAIGYGSSTSQANTFAVGSTTSKRRIVNLADGTSISDAVTVGQMNTAIGAAITNTGVKSNGMLGASTMMLGATSSKTPDQLIVSGPTTLSTATDALGKNGIAMGLNAHANADNAVAAGQNVSVLGSNGVAVGQNIAIGADSAVGIGSTVSAASINSVAIGSNGTEVNTGSDNSVAIGSNVSVGGKNTVAIGSNIITGTEGSVVLGANSSDDNRANTVSVGASAVPGMGTSLLRRQIINVAAGTQDTDAVNVSQLKGVTTALGGGAGVNADGSVNKPSYDVAGSTYSDVGSALAAVDAKAATGSVDGVKYDTSAHDKVTFSGSSGTTLSNVKAGTADMDAVNLAQLKAAGLNVDTSGNVTNSFVAYDDATKGSITLAGGTAGTTIANVKAGALSATSMDAVNGSQLYATNQNVAKNTGDITTLNTQVTNINGALADAVKYDTSAHDKVTLAGGAAGTTITNVKAGAVGAASTDAINGSQLYNTASSTAAALGGGSTVDANGRIVKPSYNVAGSTYGDVGSALAAVDAKAATGSVDGIKYDTSAHDRVTFNGANGTILSNVNAGVGDKDAVNVAQLKSAGLNIDTSGNVTNAFVSYDDASKSKISLGGADGTTIANVKAGAVNAASKEAINGSQLYNVASSTASALGGGSTVNADGTVSAPTYSLNEGSTSVHTVGDAISNLDGRVTQNTGDITNIRNTLIDGGVIDGTTGKSLAVVYDSATKDSVTFGGKDATAPVALHNVAAGALSATSTDAVNGSQLFATNKRIDDINYNFDHIGDAVMYDTSAHDRITLGGVAGGAGAPVVLTNVANGKGQYDAVNFGQLSALQGQVTNIDKRVTVVEGQITNISGGGSWNNDAGGKKITNVAAGTATSDAVNVGQLNDAVADANSYTDARVGDLPQGMSSKDYTDQRINSMQSQVNSVAKNAYGGIAAATALTMIPDVDQGKTIAVGVGTGNYKGYQAMALGASARITQNLKVKIGAGMAPGNGTTVGAGASYQW